jgi:hypothetical protein
MVYEWVVGKHKVDANVAGKVCESLEHTVGLTKETLLEASRSEDAPLHDEFEWDDAVAAEKHRLEQSHRIIQDLRVVRMDVNTEETVIHKAFVTVENTRHARRFESVTALAADPVKSNSMLAVALKELSQFKRKYNSLSELCGVMDAIEDVEEKYVLPVEQNTWQRVQA